MEKLAIEEFHERFQKYREVRNAFNLSLSNTSSLLKGILEKLRPGTAEDAVNALSDGINVLEHGSYRKLDYLIRDEVLNHAPINPLPEPGQTVYALSRVYELFNRFYLYACRDIFSIQKATIKCIKALNSAGLSNMEEACEELNKVNARADSLSGELNDLQAFYKLSNPLRSAAETFARKRVSFELPIDNSRTHLSGRIHIKLLSRTPISESGNSLLAGFYGQVVYVCGNEAQFIQKMLQFYLEQMNFVLSDSKELLLKRFGPIINFSIAFELEFESDEATLMHIPSEYDFAGKMPLFKGWGYDPAGRLFRIGVNPIFLLNAMFTRHRYHYDQVIVHELAHLLDRNLVVEGNICPSCKKSYPGWNEAMSRCPHCGLDANDVVRWGLKIRQEGLARLTNFIFRGRLPGYLFGELNRMLSEEEQVQNYAMLTRLCDQFRDFAYQLGEYMSLVIVCGVLYRRFGDLKNPASIGAMEKLLRNEQVMDFAKRHLFSTVNLLNVKNFFRFYIKYASELKLPLIMSPVLIEQLSG